MSPRPLKLTSLLLRLLQFLLSAFLLGYFTYLIVRLSQSDTRIFSHGRTLAIEIIAGISTIYTILLLLTTILGHDKLFKLSLLLDIVHVGALIAVAVLLRRAGVRSCSSEVFPGSGERRDCILLKTSFAVGIALAALFLLTALLSYLLIRSHKRGAAFGPGPENGYSTKHNAPPPSKRDRGSFPPTLNNRTSAVSNDTAYTGSTLAGGGGALTSTHDATRKSAVNPPIGMATTTTNNGPTATTTGTGTGTGTGMGRDYLPIQHPAPPVATYRSGSPLPPPPPQPPIGNPYQDPYAHNSSYNHHINHNNPRGLNQPVMPTELHGGIGYGYSNTGTSTGGPPSLYSTTAREAQYTYEPYRAPTPVHTHNHSNRNTFGSGEPVEMPVGPGEEEEGYGRMQDRERGYF